jgi:hypothetical protein
MLREVVNELVNKGIIPKTQTTGSMADSEAL